MPDSSKSSFAYSIHSWIQLGDIEFNEFYKRVRIHPQCGSVVLSGCS